MNATTNGSADRFETMARSAWPTYHIVSASDGGAWGPPIPASSATMAAHRFLATGRGPLPCDALVILHGRVLAVISNGVGNRPEVLSLPLVKNVLAVIPQADYQRYHAEAIARTEADATVPAPEADAPTPPWMDADTPDPIETIAATDAEITEAAEPVKPARTGKKARREAARAAAAAVADSDNPL